MKTYEKITHIIFTQVFINIKYNSIFWGETPHNLFIITGYSMPQMAKSFTKSRRGASGLSHSSPLRELPIDPL
jgi:hypothetical protein